MSKLRAGLIEIFNRVIPINISDNVYNNDIDNLYPNRIEGIINNSPTASKCAKIFSKFIAGDGLLDPTADVVVNKSKNYTVLDVIGMIADNVSYQNGCFIHFGYGADMKPNSIDILEYKKCRISKRDDNKFQGKIIYKDWSEKQTWGKKTKSQWFYPFNENKDVILAQMKADSPNAKTPEDLVKGYRGQVLYLNLTPQYQYALPLIDSVYNDADTEYRLSLYVNGQMRNGFMDQTIILTHEIDEESDREIHDNLTKLMGAENASKMYHMAAPQSYDLDKILVTKQIPSSFKPELLDKINGHLRSNISGIFENIPGAFVGIDSATLFGDSAEKYGQMKDFYSEQTAKYRKAVEKIFTFLNLNIQIKPISGAKSSTFEENNILKLKAQAQLKGTVGAAVEIRNIAKDVSLSILDLEAAVQIVINVFGYNETEARSMIGTPKIIVP